MSNILDDCVYSIQDSFFKFLGKDYGTSFFICIKVFQSLIDINSGELYR